MDRNRVPLLIITFYLIFNVSVAILKYLYVFIVTLMVAAQSLEGGGPVGREGDSLNSLEVPGYHPLK